MSKKWFFLTCLWVVLICPVSVPAVQDRCVRCHKKDNPVLVADWKDSAMAGSGMGCADCHGRAHTGPGDADKAVMPAIDVCGKCHKDQAERFTMGKHGKAEEALSIPPMGKKVNKQSPIVFERSCATCHNGICKGGGQCDACHAGHTFSAKEARKPESCLPCHMGNHPQYEAYSFSKHGALYKSRGLDAGVPTCSTCHMPGGDHMVKTSWGFFGVRGEEPDAERAANQKIVRGAVEMLGPVLAPDSFRPTMAQWTERREAMVSICSRCHTRSRARQHLDASDEVIAQANQIAAEFITSARQLKKTGACNQEEFFWLVRDKMHAQRMSMYIDAFHQYPEGILLEFVHFKREILDLKKRIKTAMEKKGENK
ncbi:MAG: cytochrome c3 family protein [Deltaproteobacteria bacterium]|nr:cytochrome c3 family protein [Deltaproteobacteria bacterium]